MKAILISIRPQWVALILNLIKKDEIRKGTAIGKAINKLIEEQGVAPMLIYCTKKDSLGRIKDIPHDRYFVDCVDTPQDFEKMDSGYDGKGKVVARFNATVDFLELKMIEGGLYYTTPDRDCFTPNLDLNENAQIDNWQLLSYTGEKLGTQISDIHINDLEIFDKPKELSEFRTVSKTGIPQYEFGIGTCDYKKLTKAPQSWCYVEV